MNQHTITVEVAGEETEVTLTRPMGLEYMHTVATMPAHFSQTMADGNGSMSGQDAKWLSVLAQRTADLTDEELNQIAPDDTPYFIESCVHVLVGNAPKSRSSDYQIDTSDPFGDMDLNDDGSVDTDEWR